MSSNNQTLIKEYKGKWYVFENIMAESWVHYDEETDTFDDERLNELELRKGKEFETEDEALNYACELEHTMDDLGYIGTEYGISDVLVKDGADVKIVE